MTTPFEEPAGAAEPAPAPSPDAPVRTSFKDLGFEAVMRAQKPVGTTAVPLRPASASGTQGTESPVTPGPMPAPTSAFPSRGTADAYKNRATGFPPAPEVIIPDVVDEPRAPTATHETAKPGLWRRLLGLLPGKRTDGAEVIPPWNATRELQVREIKVNRPLYKSIPVLAAAAFAVLAGGGGYGYAMLTKPEPIVLAPAVETIWLPSPEVAPISLPSTTDFVSSLPDTVIDFALTLAEPGDWELRGALPTRIAEFWTLTYGNSDGDIITVTAYQHYTEDEALAALEVFSAGAASEPIEVNGVEVGASAVLEDGSIVWRNGTAVFVMASDTVDIADYFTEYPL